MAERTDDSSPIKVYFPAWRAGKYTCKFYWKSVSAPRLDFVEGRVGEVNIPGVHLFLAQAQTFAEVINLSKSPGAQCLQGFRGFFSGRENVRSSLNICPLASPQSSSPGCPHSSHGRSLPDTKPASGKWGYPTVKVGFNEPRRKQSAAKGKRSYYFASNAMIANVLEYGKSGQPPKPFLKPAKSASRKACTEAMIKKFEEEIKKL